MKKSYYFLTGWMFLMVLGAVWLNQGCAAKIAPMPSIAPTSTATRADNVISDFDNGKSSVNPTLRGVLDPVWYTGSAPPGVGGVGGAAERGLGNWSVNTYGGGAIANTIDGSSPNNRNILDNPCFVQAIPGTPASLASNTSIMAAHIFGPLYITTGKYESHQLICHFRNSVSNPYFDASTFSGIRFDYYLSSADTNLVPVFQVGIDLTTPPSAGAGGTCLGSSCYNHYQYGLNAVPRDTWVTVSMTWNQLLYSFGTNYGSNLGNCNINSTPCGNRHLKKILLLQFQSSDNSSAQSTNYTDYWVDNVEFF